VCVWLSLTATFAPFSCSISGDLFRSYELRLRGLSVVGTEFSNPAPKSTIKSEKGGATQGGAGRGWRGPWVARA
jgi:hypothetical protein